MSTELAQQIRRLEHGQSSSSMRMRTLMAFASCVPAFVAACGELLSESPAVVDDDAGNAGVDASPPDGASSDVTTSTPLPIYSQGFEGMSPCDAWTARFMSATASTVAHSGMRACQICTDGTTNDGYIFRTLNVGRGPGRYVLTAWARGTPSPPDASARATLRLRGFAADASPTAADVVGGPNPIGASYTQISAAVTTDAAVEALEITFISSYQDQGCWLFDDVEIAHEP